LAIEGIGQMLKAIEKRPIAPARTPAALEFADRLRELGVDIQLVMLAVEAACNRGDDEDGVVILVALRKLRCDIEQLADQVLPPLTREQQRVIEEFGPRVPR
jgi:hypothetical protein